MYIVDDSAERFDTPAVDASPQPDANIEARISSVGQRLRDAVARLLDAVPGKPARPVDLARALGINQDLSRKLLMVVAKPDALAATAVMPGPEALRLVLKAARRKSLDQDLIRDVERPVRDFDDLLRRVLDGRSGLDAAVSAWLPEAREGFEQRHKQAIFKAVSGLKGVLSDVTLNTILVLPSPNKPGRCDLVVLFGYRGLRRLRPDAPIHVTTENQAAERTESHVSLDGDPLAGDADRLLLSEFCSQPLPKLEVRQVERVFQYFVLGDLVGLDAAADVFFGVVVRDAMPRFRAPGESPRRVWISSEVELPTRALVFDILLHPDVWRDCDPELVLYDTAVYGTADPNDRARDVNRLHLLESVQYLGQGVSRLRIGEIPRYGEMLRHAAGRLGRDPDMFRCYRCRSPYPFYGAQFEMVFDPPTAPEPRPAE